MNPPDLLTTAGHAMADHAAIGGLAWSHPQEMLRLEALAEATAHVCPGAQHAFHEDYLGRAMLLIDLPPRGGAPACLVVAPTGTDGFDLARLIDEDLFPVGQCLDRQAVLAWLRAATR